MNLRRNDKLLTGKLFRSFTPLVSDMHALLNIAVRAARAGGASLLRSREFLSSVRANAKGRNDFVSEADLKAEQAIIDTIHKSYPEHAILAEESGARGNSDVVWIIDPLDGTTNFLHGLSHFSVSIAVQVKGRVEHGAVYDPIQDELFTATRGAGAALNDKRLRVGNKIKLNEALLATAFPFSNAALYEKYMKEFANIYPQCSDIRRLGSAALDLCYVANDRFDGYFEYGIKLWDIAAGALIVQEAGGLVSDLNGGNDFTGSNGILAANPKMYKAIAQALKGQSA